MGTSTSIDRLVAYDPELNRIRTRWFGYGPQDDHMARPDSLPLHKLRSFSEAQRRNPQKGRRCSPGTPPECRKALTCHRLGTSPPFPGRPRRTTRSSELIKEGELGSICLILGATYPRWQPLRQQPAFLQGVRAMHSKKNSRARPVYQMT